MTELMKASKLSLSLSKTAGLADLGVRFGAGPAVTELAEAVLAMHAGLFEQASAGLELADSPDVAKGAGSDIHAATISWTVFVLVLALILQLYIAEANRTGEYLLDGNRVRLLLDGSGMTSAAFVAKKITDLLVRKML